MAEHPITVTLTIADELLQDGIVDQSGAISYWASALIEKDNGKITVVWSENDDGQAPFSSKTIDRGDLARGLREVAFGKGARSDLMEHAQRAILEKDAGEIDYEIADVAIQYALFDEIVYG